VSEGGYGAVNIALHHPSVFGKVLALSGYYANDGSGWARPIMGHDDSFIAFNSPLDYITEIPATATSPLMGMEFFLGAGDNEKHYFEQTREMAKALTTRGVNETTDILPGKHGWILWSRLFIDGMTALLPKSPLDDAKPNLAPPDHPSPAPVQATSNVSVQ
jgi:esterase/lipase superfamily enzyme